MGTIWFRTPSGTLGNLYKERKPCRCKLRFFFFARNDNCCLLILLFLTLFWCKKGHLSLYFTFVTVQFMMTIGKHDLPEMTENECEDSFFHWQSHCLSVVQFIVGNSRTPTKLKVALITYQVCSVILLTYH